MTKILVVDDHEMIRKGLRNVIEAREGWMICGEAVDGRGAVQTALELKPDIILMDFAMPNLNGIEATRQIRAALPQTEILVFTMHDSGQLVREALAAGARGFVLKSDGCETLIAAIEHLVQRRPSLTPKASEMVLPGLCGPGSNAEVPVGSHLTRREREVLQLVAEGRRTKEIGDLLGISLKTAETHRVRIMRKLDLHSVGELVRYAIRHKMVEP